MKKCNVSITQKHVYEMTEEEKWECYKMFVDGGNIDSFEGFCDYHAGSLWNVDTFTFIKW